MAKSCRGSGVGGLGSDGEDGTKWGLGLAVSHGDPEVGEAGLVADSATLALREAQPDVRIEVLGLIEAMAEPITDVVTVQKARGARTSAVHGDRTARRWRRPVPSRHPTLTSSDFLTRARTLSAIRRVLTALFGMLVSIFRPYCALALGNLTLRLLVTVFPTSGERPQLRAGNHLLRMVLARMTRDRRRRGLAHAWGLGECRRIGRVS